MPETSNEKKGFNLHINPQSIKHWAVALSVALPLLLSTFSKGTDIIKYDILQMPRNDEEILVRHMFDEHLIKAEEKVENSINTTYGKITTWFYASDECVIVKRLNNNGQVLANKILAKDIDKLKESYTASLSLPSLPAEAFAAQQDFDFRHHNGDFKFEETFKRDGAEMIVTRRYADGCSLTYKLDAYGNACCWEWAYYKQ